MKYFFRYAIGIICVLALPEALSGQDSKLDLSRFVKAIDIETLKTSFPIKAGIPLSDIVSLSKSLPVAESEQSVKNGRGWVHWRMRGSHTSPDVARIALSYVDLVVENNRVKSVWVMPGAAWPDTTFVFFRLSGDGEHIGPDKWSEVYGIRKRPPLTQPGKGIDAGLLFRVFDYQGLAKSFPIRSGMTLEEIESLDRKKFPFPEERGIVDGAGWLTYWVNRPGVFFCEALVESGSVKSVWAYPGNREFALPAYYRISGSGDRVSPGRWKKIGGDSVFRLVKELKTEGPNPQAVRGLEKTSDPEKLIPIILKVTEAPNPEVRSQAVMALTEIAPAETAIPALVGLLDDPVGSVRTTVARSLGNLNAKSVGLSEKIARMAFTDNFSGNYELPLLLAKMGEHAKPAVPILITALQSDKKTVRLNALKAFGRIGPIGRPALPLLLIAAKDGDRDIAWAAVETLDGLGKQSDEVVRVLLDCLQSKHPTVANSAGYGLRSMPKMSKSFYPEILTALKSPDMSGQISESLCRLVKNIGSDMKDAVPLIVPLLKRNGNVYLRISAAKTLGGFGKHSRAALPGLKQALERARVRTDKWEFEEMQKAIRMIENAE